MMKNLIHAFKILNAPCRDMVALASRAMDDDLPRLEAFALRLHMLYCSACRRYRSQLQSLRQALRQAADTLDASEAPSLSPDAKIRLTNAVAAAANSADS